MEGRIRAIPQQCIEKKMNAVGKRVAVSEALRDSVQSKIGTILKRENSNRLELAKKMDISAGRLSQILNSDTLSLAKLEEIAKALGYEVEVSFAKTSDKI